MRYFIAGLPKGAVAAYHQAIAHNIASKFHISCITDRCLSHYTLKAPFEANEGQISELKEKFFIFSEECRASHCDIATYIISGFGHLGREIITLDMFHSRQMGMMITKLHEILRGFEWVSWSPHEPIFHLHITIAKGIFSEFDEIWEHLEGKSDPYFPDVPFSEFAILRLEEDGTWGVDSVYSLAP